MMKCGGVGYSNCQIMDRKCSCYITKENIQLQKLFNVDLGRKK